MSAEGAHAAYSRAVAGPAPGRRAIVGVMGSGTEQHVARAAPLGRWLATIGVHLLTGGGSGVMAAVSRAFGETPARSGSVLGILPGDPDTGTPLAGYPNPWVEIPVRTHLPRSGTRGTDPLSRNHVNVLSSDVVVALPGGAGTASEVTLAIRYGRPVIAFVDARADIPGLEEEVPLARTLADVVGFVERALRQGGWPA